MSPLLAKFMAQTRIKVDPFLAERWDVEARIRGEHPIKQQIAQAKRTATTLQKASDQFLKIRPEQELALLAAASAMRALASELAPMVNWAKAYKAFCGTEYIRERLAELEAFAAVRWGADAHALEFEADLMQELNSKDGKLEFAQWLHSIGTHTDVALENISTCIDTMRPGNTLRERVAATLHEDQRSTDNKWGAMRGLCLICGWKTYERYLAYRKDIATRTVAVIAGMSAVKN